jgi:SAM-dependent methyltransferase
VSELLIDIVAVTLFYSYVRVDFLLGGSGEDAFNAALLCDGQPITQRSVRASEDGSARLVLDCLIDRERFPAAYTLQIGSGGSMRHFSCIELLQAEEAKYSKSLRGAFDQMVEEAAAVGSEPPRLLDLGGRPRSGNLLSAGYSRCDVTIVDAEPDPAVHVIADAHQMSKALPAASFDFVLCVSVFEHLIMPWKVAVEMNRVMKPGGVALISTHQTLGMHDQPRDFFRYSSDAWPAFFNQWTGFEIVAADMNQFLHITSRHGYLANAYPETSGGFGVSSVIVRKVGDTSLTWEVPAAGLCSERYPG